jgi:hypothetical protein
MENERTRILGLPIAPNSPISYCNLTLKASFGPKGDNSKEEEL